MRRQVKVKWEMLVSDLNLCSLWQRKGISMSFRFLLAALPALFLAACNPVANFEAGERKIERWQEAYDQEDYDKLWSMTGPEFRKFTTRDQFDDFLKVLHARLGLIQSTERSGFNVNSNLGAPTRTVVSMETVFEQGKGAEIFTFHGQADDLELVGWQVNSDRLMVAVEDLAEDLPEPEPAK